MNNRNDLDESILVCRCHSTQHQIVIRYDEEDNLIYCYIHLSGPGFWKRLKHGLRYIFGYRSKFGDWDEFIFSEAHAPKLQQMADILQKDAQ